MNRRGQSVERGLVARAGEQHEVPDRTEERHRVGAAMAYDKFSDGWQRGGRIDGSRIGAVDTGADRIGFDVRRPGIDCIGG